RVRSVQLRDGNTDHVAHAAVGMHAQNLQLRAAVRLAASAGDAAPAVQVRLDRTPVADLDSARVRADGQYLHTQFVPQDARIAEEGLIAAIGVQVRAADADAAHTHQRLVCAEIDGRFGLCE